MCCEWDVVCCCCWYGECECGDVCVGGVDGLCGGGVFGWCGDVECVVGCVNDGEGGLCGVVLNVGVVFGGCGVDGVVEGGGVLCEGEWRGREGKV